MEITAAAMNTTTPPIIGAAADCCAGTKENNNNWLFSFNYNNCKYFGYNLLSISVRKITGSEKGPVPLLLTPATLKV